MVQVTFNHNIHTNKQLLQLFIAVIDAKLLKAIVFKNFKSVNIQYTNQSTFILVSQISIVYSNGSVNFVNNPRKQSVINSLSEGVPSKSSFSFCVFFPKMFENSYIVDQSIVCMSLLWKLSTFFHCLLQKKVLRVFFFTWVKYISPGTWSTKKKLLNFFYLEYILLKRALYKCDYLCKLACVSVCVGNYCTE